jgi:signal peptidase I
VLADPTNYPVVVHPVDKTDNYIKRCVGVAGDLIEIKGNVVYANGVKQDPPPYSEINYIVTTNARALDADMMKEEYDLDAEKNEYSYTNRPNEFRMLLTEKARQKMLTSGLAANIVVDTTIYGGGGSVFPYDTIGSRKNWSRDNFGPVWIPKKGEALQLSAENYALYERAIRVYEQNEFYMSNGRFYLNGQEVTSYTFKMDYYWMMGDNRQGSQDSRYWGFVPEDRIVGKAWMIWFSWEGGPRWNRLFNIVR